MGFSIYIFMNVFGATQNWALSVAALSFVSASSRFASLLLGDDNFIKEPLVLLSALSAVAASLFGALGALVIFK